LIAVAFPLHLKDAFNLVACHGLFVASHLLRLRQWLTLLVPRQQFFVE
jgi:hypothetical protein